jgi:DNA invertase Pin-like site-specific DNA recombinase
MKTAISYIRVSTDDQVRGGVSLDAQEERIRAYCEASNLKLISVVREEGVSAAIPLDQRPGGRNLIRQLNESKGANVVALKLDRLFRNAEDALKQTRHPRNLPDE